MPALTTPRNTPAWSVSPQLPASRNNHGRNVHVIAVGIQSLDGRATLGDTSGGLGNPFDQHVLLQQRFSCDAVIIGAGTLRAENYAIDAPPTWLDDIVPTRSDNGLSPLPHVFVITETLNIPRTAAIFHTSQAPVFLTLPITDGSLRDERRRNINEAGGTVIECGDLLPATIIATVASIVDRDDQCRIAVEGGPRVYTDFMRAGVVDEWSLTIAPVVVGKGPHLCGDVQRPFNYSLTSEFRCDSHVFVRYLACHDR